MKNKPNLKYRIEVKCRMEQRDGTLKTEWRALGFAFFHIQSTAEQELALYRLDAPDGEFRLQRKDGSHWTVV